jgi:hypothetical protein
VVFRFALVSQSPRIAASDDSGLMPRAQRRLRRRTWNQLGLRGRQPLPGNRQIGWVELDPDPMPALQRRGQQRGAGTHERVQDHRTRYPMQPDAPAGQFQWEGARVVEFLRYYLATATTR